MSNEYTELVQRLREWPRVCQQYEDSVDQLHDQAADAIEALQRPHGKWENTGSDVWQCSQCGYGIMPWNAGVNFCPNCGADMREVT